MPLRSGATCISGSLVALSLSCFSGSGYIPLAVQSRCLGFKVYPLCSWVLGLTPSNSQKNCLLFSLELVWNFGSVLALSWSKTCEAGLWLPPQNELYVSEIQTQATGQSCHNFLWIFLQVHDKESGLCIFCLPVSTLVNKTVLLKCELWDFSFSAGNQGQQQWFLCLYCITQASLDCLVSQAGLMEQNSKIREYANRNCVTVQRLCWPVCVVITFLLELSCPLYLEFLQNWVLTWRNIICASFLNLGVL